MPKVTLKTQQGSFTSKPVKKLKVSSILTSTAKQMIINSVKIKVSYGNIVEKKVRSIIHELVYYVKIIIV